MRKATLEDMPKIIQLWQQVFGDEKEKIELWVNDFAKLENVFVACDLQGNVVAQLLAVPCFVKENKGIYLYALATNPTQRGKGTMTRLMEYAEEYYLKKDFLFSCLVPANIPLFSFYAKRGYKKATKLVNGIFCQNKNTMSLESYKCGKISVDEFSALRKKFIGLNYVSLELVQEKVVLEDFYEQKGQVVVSDRSYCLFLPSSDKIKVIELFAESEKDVENILNSVCECTKTDKLTINVSSNSLGGVEYKMQSDDYSAMFKPLKSNFAIEDLYIRMVLEEF